MQRQQQCDGKCLELAAFGKRVEIRIGTGEIRVGLPLACLATHAIVSETGGFARFVELRSERLAAITEVMLTTRARTTPGIGEIKRAWPLSKPRKRRSHGERQR